MESVSRRADQNPGGMAMTTAQAAAKPSVVFLISHSSPGGAQEIWTNIADGFRHRGYAVELMALYPRREERATPAGLSWTYAADKLSISPFAQMRVFLALVRRLRAKRPVVVYSALPAANVLAAAAASLIGGDIRVIISHHSPAETYNRLLNILDSMTGSFSKVRAIVSVSKAVERSQEDKPRAYLKKRRTIYNALPPDIERQIETLAKWRDGAPRARRVVATGRLAPQKNYPVLIRAARHLPDVIFDIIGGGPEEASLRALAAELHVADRVRFLGFKPRSEALRSLAEGDIFVQPSLFEGHSLALVEAAKLGLPLVVSDVPVQIEGVTARNGVRCGLAVDPHDDAALARAIGGLLDDPGHYDDYASRSVRLGREATYDVMLNAYESLVQ
jgi:glycosyltransferase involved in cell wall biosynthesis